MDYRSARENMIDSQLKTNRVTSEELLEAFSTVPREIFLPESRRGFAYLDEDVAIGGGRYLMEPMVLARLLQEAQIGPEDVVLDVGAGSGYASAVIGQLGATVVALESDAELAAQAGKTLEQLGIDNVVVVEGPLAEGYAKQSPFNVILLNGAVAKLPDAITAQLADGGRLITVIREGKGLGKAVLARRSGGSVSSRVVFDAATPYLQGFEPEPAFTF